MPRGKVDNLDKDSKKISKESPKSRDIKSKSSKKSSKESSKESPKGSPKREFFAKYKAMSYPEFLKFCNKKENKDNYVCKDSNSEVWRTFVMREIGEHSPNARSYREELERYFE